MFAYSLGVNHIKRHTESVTMANRTIEDNALDEYFSPDRSGYSSADVEQIAKLLKHHSDLRKHGDNPRLYIILRHMNCLSELAKLHDAHFSDFSLPLQATQLPPECPEWWKDKFMDAQKLVCDSSDLVEMMRERKHGNFTLSPTCFESKRIIHSSEKTRIDVVTTTLERTKVFARKRFFRNRMALDDIESRRLFENELRIMREIVHHHCVKLVSSLNSSLMVNRNNYLTLLVTSGSQLYR